MGMLSARSPVFEAMFFSNMAENKSGTVNVEDVDPDVMIEVLQYIYTGCSLNIDKHAMAILAASEKYLIEQLKGCCESVPSDSLKVPVYVSSKQGERSSLLISWH